jgi:hypothetical protein
MEGEHDSDRDRSTVFNPPFSGYFILVVLDVGRSRTARRNCYDKIYDLRGGTDRQHVVPSLDPFIQGGSTVYIPASDGLYVTVISRLWRWRYNRGLRRWLRRGANVHLVITRTTDHCREIWQRVIDKYPLTFHLHLLNREKAIGVGADSLRFQIDRLDTFHPVLVVNSRGPFVPGAMWIEGYHPVGSKYADNVEFVHPSAAAKDERLQKYNEMFERLI